MQPLKKDMEPISYPTEKPVGRSDARNRGRDMARGGGQQPVRVPGNGRGAGDWHQHDGRGGRGNGGFGPPFPGGAEPQVIARQHDLNDMLRQLSRRGYSDEPGYFDFSEVAPMVLPVYQGAGATIELPVIGLESLLTRMVYESKMEGNDEDVARRRNVT